MRIHKFTSTTAFVAIDLDGAEAASGPVRWARKVLQGGAKDLARSQTYTYAVLGMRRSGASAGISAEADDRAGAVAAFVEEAATMVADGTYLPDAAKGITEDDLAPLRDADPRDTARLAGTPSFADRCEALSVVTAALHTAAGLEGRTVAIEGFGPTGPLLAELAVQRGATVTTIATSKGVLGAADGLDPGALAEGWASAGEGLVLELGEAGPAPLVFDADADIWFVGSKTGVVDHTAAARIGEAVAVVPSGRLPITARGLAVLRRAGVAVPGDFLSLAGATLALWGDPNRTEAEILAGIDEDIGDLAGEFRTHDDGPFLAACFAAEAFLSQWQDTLPFGRPLAP